MGAAPAELRRVGRLADGWLASFTTPDQCKTGRVTIEESADAAGREIDGEHFGAMVLYARNGVPGAFAQAIAGRNPDVELDDLVARDWPELHDLCARYISVGFSKLVLVPLGEPPDWDDELAAAAAALLPLQNQAGRTRN